MTARTYPEMPVAGIQMFSSFYRKFSLLYGYFMIRNCFKKTGLKISEKKFYRLLNVLI